MRIPIQLSVIAVKIGITFVAVNSKLKNLLNLPKITPFNLFVFSVTMQNALNVQNLFLAIKMVSNVIHVTPGATLPVQDLVLNNT